MWVFFFLVRCGEFIWLLSSISFNGSRLFRSRQIQFIVLLNVISQMLQLDCVVIYWQNGSVSGVRLILVSMLQIRLSRLQLISSSVSGWNLMSCCFLWQVCSISRLVVVQNIRLVNQCGVISCRCLEKCWWILLMLLYYWMFRFMVKDRQVISVSIVMNVQGWVVVGIFLVGGCIGVVGVVKGLLVMLGVFV